MAFLADDLLQHSEQTYYFFIELPVTVAWGLLGFTSKEQ